MAYSGLPVPALGWLRIHSLPASIHRVDNPVLTSLHKVQLRLNFTEYRDVLPQSHAFEHSNHRLN